MKSHSFTMIELLAVIAIILVLAGILIGGINFASRKAEDAQTQSKFEALETALESFKAEYGYYPICTSIDEVRFQEDADDASKPKIKLGGKMYPFVKKNGGAAFIDVLFVASNASGADANSKYLDAWDNAFRYQCPGTHNKQKYDLWSYGQDERDNTEDDIKNW